MKYTMDWGSMKNGCVKRPRVAFASDRREGKVWGRVGCKGLKPRILTPEQIKALGYQVTPRKG